MAPSSNCSRAAEGAPYRHLAESRSFVRRACRVELDRGAVTRADYNFAD